MENTYRPDRLIKLAKFLETGDFGNRQFSFNSWNDGGTEKHPCGTAGCAVGFAPIVFPRDWTFIPSKKVYSNKFIPALKKLMKDGGLVDPLESAQEFFGISKEHAQGLFIPSGLIYAWNDSVLTIEAKRSQVAQGIRNYVEWRKKQVAVDALRKEFMDRIEAVKQDAAKAGMEIRVGWGGEFIVENK